MATGKKQDGWEGGPRVDGLLQLDNGDLRALVNQDGSVHLFKPSTKENVDIVRLDEFIEQLKALRKVGRSYYPRTWQG